MTEATRRRRDAEYQVKLRAHILKTCEDFPPLSPAQRDRLALLFNPQVPDDAVLSLPPTGGDALAEMMGDE
jgi:hypothetical protein